MRLHQIDVDFTGTCLDGISWCILEPYPGVSVRLSYHLSEPSWIEWWTGLMAQGITAERWRQMPVPSPFRLERGQACLCLTTGSYPDQQPLVLYDGDGRPQPGDLDDDYRVRLPLSLEQMAIIRDGLVGCFQPGTGVDIPPAMDLVDDTSGTIEARDVISYQEGRASGATEPLQLVAPLVILTALTHRVSVDCRQLVIYPAEDGTFILPTILQERTLVTICVPDGPDHRRWTGDGLTTDLGVLPDLEVVYLCPYDAHTLTLMENGARVVVAPRGTAVPPPYRKTARHLGESRLRIWVGVSRAKSARSVVQ